MAISLQSYQASQQSQTIQSTTPSRGIRSQIKQDVKALSTALQTGDLSGAQKSYGDLQKLLQGNGAISQGSTTTTAPQATSVVPSGPLSTVRSDFQALGNDLQSGDLAAAQKDYAQLATDSQKILAQERGTHRSGGHHRIRSSDSDSDGDSSSKPAPSSPNSTSSAQVSAYQFSLSGSFTGTTTGSPTGSAPFGQIKSDFHTIEQDLQTGNLEGVKKDYAQLLKDAEHLAGSDDGSSSNTATPTSTAASSTPSSGLSAYQFSFSAKFESVSATTTSASGDSSSSSAQSYSAYQDSFQSLTTTSTNNGQVTGYQATSFQESFQSASFARTEPKDDPAVTAASQSAQSAGSIASTQSSFQRLSYVA